MTDEAPDTDMLLKRASNGDAAAVNELLLRHRERLKRMVAVRLDDRLRSRVDPSDLVQETLTKAADRLQKYTTERPLPFYPWLRQLALDELIRIHRRHIVSQRRSVSREVTNAGLELSGASRLELANQLMAKNTSPSEHVVRQELLRRVDRAIARLEERDHEVLVLRHLEQLSTREAAAILGVSENTFAQRHVRALRRVRKLIDEPLVEE